MTAGTDAPERAAARPVRTSRTGASAGVVALLTVGGVATGWATAELAARVGAAGVRVPPAGRADASPRVPPTASVTPPDARPGAAVLRAGATVDPASNASWGRSAVTLHVSERLTALTVELRVVRTDGLRRQDGWHTLPAGDVEETVRAETDGDGTGLLVFRWRLREGAAVPPGTYRFAAQYRRAAGRRDASGDRYRVFARGPGGRSRAAAPSTERSPLPRTPAPARRGRGATVARPAARR